MPCMTELVEIPAGTVPDLSGAFADGTPFELARGDGGVLFRACGMEIGPVPEAEAQGLYSVQAEDGTDYRIYVSAPGRSPRDAFLEADGRLWLADPHALSPEDWSAFGGAVRKLGYDAGSPETARLIFSRLCREHRSEGRPGYPLRPDQRDAVERLWFGRADSEAERKARTAYARKIQNKAVRLYGLTEDFGLAGYLRPDGNMLDFSRMGIQRDVDHREVSELFGDELPDDEPGSNRNGMLAFMAIGNIRLTHGGLDMLVRPTKQQEAVIRRFCRRYREEYVHLDFMGPSGCPAAAWTLDPFSDPEDAIRTIRTYFATGWLPGEADADGFDPDP